MKVRALRGVCIGVGRHLKPSETADLDTAMVTFLTGIGAVEVVPDAPPETEKAAVERGPSGHETKPSQPETAKKK